MPRCHSKGLTLLCLSLIGLSGSAGASQSDDDPRFVGHFSAEQLSHITPVGWRPLIFPSIANKTAYFLTRDRDRTVVQAVSHASASAYFKKVSIDPQRYPILRWSWKIQNTLAGGDIRSREGDDYAARIYVAFDYDPARLTGLERVKYKLYLLLHDEPPPLAVINYVWGNQAAPGTMVSNAYSSRVKMIVLRSGAAQLRHWLTEERDIYQDYQAAFGEKPGKITGIAIMTDTDNTGESATAWYGDIGFHRPKR